MAKQSWKQQMYQQIANSQVQQVMQQKNQDLQLAQSLIAQYQPNQPNNDDLALAQSLISQYQPQQSAPVQTVKAAPKQEVKQEAIPSLADFFKPTTASGKDINKEAVAKLSEDEARLEAQRAKRKEAAKDTLNMFNTNEFKDAVKKGEAQRIADKKEKASKTIGGSINQLDLGKYNLPSDSGITEQEQKSFDDYTKALEWSDPNYRMTKEEQKEARRIASEGKQALAEKYPVENKADFGKLYERMTPEDQEKYRTYDNLSLKSDPVSVASVGAADKAVNMLGGALNTLAFFHPGAIPAARDYKELQKKWNEGMEETETEAIAKSATPLAENVPLIGEITPYGVGQAATQLGAYALTNSAFDEAGAALLGDKLGKVGGFIGNQIGQNAQDIALDTIPRYQELKAQGKSDEEIRDTLLEEGLWNVGGNLGLGLLGEIPGLWKSAKNNLKAKNVADKAFRQNVREGADKLARLAGTEDVDNVVRNATRQYEEAAQNIENISKQMPEIPENVPNAVNNIPENVTENVTENVPVRPGTAAPVSPAIENEAEAMAKAMDAEEVENVVRNIDQLQAETPIPKKEGYTQPDYQEILDKYRAGERLSQYEDEALQSALLEEKYDNLRRYSDNVVTVEKADIPDDVLKYMIGNNYENQLDSVKLSAELAKRGFNLWENGFNNNIMANYSTLLDAVAHHLAQDNIPAEIMAEAYDITYKNGGTLDDAIKLAADMSGTKLANPTYGEGVKLSAKAQMEAPKLLSDDVEAQLAYDFENIGDSYYGNRAAIKQSLESKDFSIPNTAINDVPGKNGKMQYEIVDLDNNRKIKTYASRKAAEKAQAEYAAGNVLKEKAIKAFDDLDGAIYRYEQAAYNSADVEEVNTAKKAVEAARKRYERAMKEYDPSYYDAVASKDFGDRIARPYYTRNPAAENPVDDALIDDMVNDWVQTDASNPNRFVRDSQPDNVNIYRGVNDVPGAEPLQTFADGNTPKDQWKTSKFRTNTAEKLGWGENMPEKNYAYRVHTEAEQNAESIDRYAGLNRANELLNKNYDDFDEVDIKAAFNEMKALQDAGDIKSLRMADRIGQKTAAVQRQGARIVQASAEYTRDTFGGALSDAHKAQDDLVLDPWRSKNKKAREGNSRIAKALADMGHKADAKIKPELTHDQIKKGVIAELNREVGSVEKYFNDNDIEYLTRLAEDKSIPTWKITSEIEHKLNTGNWYTLDESIDIPKPTNRKLQNALDSLVTETVRAESQKPSLSQIVEEVRNTLGKESAEFEGLFTEDDINYLANLINEGATKEELTEALDLKLATGNFGISDATLQEVNNIFKQISNYDPNSKQFVEGQAEAYRLLANEILPNATLKEKFEAWRYIAMLGNPKTMLRNYIGNQTFNVVTGISNNVAAIAEAGIDRAAKAIGGEGIQRTKAVLNPKTDSGLIKACAEDADASRYRQIIGSKYEKMSKDTLRRSKSVFNSKIAQLYEKVTDAGISDYSAVKEKYSTSLAGYMKANGMNTDIFKAEEELRNLRNLSETRLLSDAEKARVATLSNQVQELEKARDYALKQAEYATFHEDNKIANVLSKWSRTSKEEGTGIGHILLEGMVPFKKTPANVLRSGVEYSPLGAIDSIRKTGKLIYENTGKRAGNLADVYKNKAGKEVARTFASDVIDSWSKTLTGTGLTALGFFLYNKGILHSSDPDTKYQDELEGHQNYAIEINGKSYTIDWAAPTIMPLMVGAEIAKLWDSTGKGDEDFYNNIDGYLDAANRISDPLIETSMLQGVRDTLETAATYAQNTDERKNILPLLIYNTATGYATQGIPTLGGQIARTIDPTRRSTYTDKKGVPGVLDKQLKKQMNKIPGVSMLNQPYVDTYGREQQNSPFNNPVGNLAYQMVSPGYLSNVNETDADIMSREAYEVSKNANTLPKWQSKFTDAEGNRVSPEDYTTASKAYGQANYEIREAFANDEWFNSLDDTQKEEIVKGINTIAEHVGNAAIDPEYSKDAKAYNAYKDGGVEGLKEYWKEQVGKNKAKESGLSSTSNASKAIQEDMANGNEEAAQQKIDAAVSLQNLGLSKPGPTYTYYNAQTVIPGLTTEDFAKTYKTIDSDGNQGIKQDEVIAYLNSKKITSESEANKIWSAYGSSEWKSIPKLENGKWVKKKK